MEKTIYITTEEKEKCQRVTEAFTELYELMDTVVVDAGKYGFVKLQFYKYPRGFDNIMTYTDSQSLFNDLWDDWFSYQLLTPILGTPDAELKYEEIWKRLPKPRQEEILAKKIYFQEKAFHH